MIAYRTASLAELDTVLAWAAEEGWNPGHQDAEAFFRADPHGFFVAVDRDDRPVAAISVVNHTADFAFLGLYIVRPEHRGQGIGFGLWTHALAHAGDRVVGLDGVEAQQGNYRRSGFDHAGGTTRFTGPLEGRPHGEIRVAGAGEIPDLVQREAQASGVAKPRYLTAWFTASATRTTLVHGPKTGFRGMCTVRTCRSGVKIGPLVAEDIQVAEDLIAHGATLFGGPVTVDVPGSASPLAEICQRLGLDPGFRTARMYRGPFAAPAHPLFAPGSLELG